MQNVYLRTSKVLSHYKAEEIKWRREKKALEDEVRLLKDLLTSSDHIKDILFNQK